MSEQEDIPWTETEVVGMLFDEKDLKSNRKKKNAKKSKGKLLRILCNSGTSDNTMKRSALNKLKYKTVKNPKLWSSFGGELGTTYTAKNVEFYLPEFSTSKSAVLDFDIIEDKNRHKRYV